MSQVVEEENVWYLAIGSMMNPVSLRLRELNPIQSMPAELKGYRLAFMFAGGMASIEKDENQSLHGVLHLMTPQDMKTLDSIEASYLRVPVVCTLYDGREQPATAYMFDENKVDRTQPNNPPSERYIDILTQGARHYGLKQEYIDWLASHPVVPRRKPSEFRKFEPKPGVELRSYTMEELTQSTGVDGRELLTCVNRKILRFCGDRNSPMFATIRDRWGGRDSTFRMAALLYEPKYPPVFSPSDMVEEHRHFIEDMFVGWQNNNWEQIGYLQEAEN
eukprot:TRINITY_DN2629_c0_g1_i2.p1 TRINITY_DN2629_c0_g1~~TRINITY_DN2629_c0_g1_i2.p1  ORF type:complete len:276 (-),score=80.13 TRINITY_DN2629_c0_g1_i2:118-945(-)